MNTICEREGNNERLAKLYRTISEPDFLVNNFEDSQTLIECKPETPESSIFVRPGFGSVSFRGRFTSETLFSKHMSDESSGRKESDRSSASYADSIGSAGSLAHRNALTLGIAWDEEDDEDVDNSKTIPILFFLYAHGLKDYFSLFAAEKIDLEALMLLSEQDFISLGLPLGPRQTQDFDLLLNMSPQTKNKSKNSKDDNKDSRRRSSSASSGSSRSRSGSRSSSSGSSRSSSSSGSSRSSASHSRSRSPSRSSSSSRSRDSSRRRRQRSASPKRAVRKPSPTPKPTRIHVGRLTRNVTKDHVMEIFSVYGTVRNVEMPFDRIHPHLSRGFAYVEFDKPEDADKAIKYMDGGQVDGQEVSATPVLVP
ncbi:unnamed protein product, partial [Medioppia subpectinata]